MESLQANQMTYQQIKLIRCAALFVSAGLFLSPSSAGASSEAAAQIKQTQTLAARSSSPTILRGSYDSYILGPGDSLSIELLGIPELSGSFSIGPDGTIYLPRLRALFVEGLTVEELRFFLSQQFKTYVKDPQIYIKPIGYRAVRVYVGGEISRPGFYMLSGGQILQDQISILSGTSPQETRRQATNLQDFAAARSIGKNRCQAGC